MHPTGAQEEREKDSLAAWTEIESAASAVSTHLLQDLARSTQHQAAAIGSATENRQKVRELIAKVSRQGSGASIEKEMQGLLDSMSEMGEMESLRLQMVMDRYSKMMNTLSNILKKISDTQRGIIQNLK